MTKQFRSFLRDEEGGTLIEYTFLASLIAMAAILAMAGVGTAVSGQLGVIAVALS